jgi:serine/threonine-protein kinase ULK4
VVSCYASVALSSFAQNISANEEDDIATTEQPAVEDLIWHPSDSAVKPIVGNRRIERVAEPRWEARSLSFPAMVPPSPPFASLHM